MTGAAVAAAMLAGVSVLAAGDARAVAQSRLRRLSSPDPGTRLAGDAAVVSWGGSSRRAAGLMTACVVATLAVLPVAVGSLGRAPVLAALATAVLLLAGRRLSVRSAARQREREVAAALPRFADLVAACLESGAAPADALDVVRHHVPGPVADRLAPVAGALRSGVDPLSVYGVLGRDDPVRGLVVALARAMESGSPLADTVAAVADEQRRRRRWSAEAAARRAGVLAVGPLVVCFLPAFVLLGVVPVVLGIAADVLGDLS